MRNLRIKKKIQFNLVRKLRNPVQFNLKLAKLLSRIGEILRIDFETEMHLVNLLKWKKNKRKVRKRINSKRLINNTILKTN